MLCFPEEGQYHYYFISMEGRLRNIMCWAQKGMSRRKSSNYADFGGTRMPACLRTFVIWTENFWPRNHWEPWSGRKLNLGLHREAGLVLQPLGSIYFCLSLLLLPPYQSLWTFAHIMPTQSRCVMSFGSSLALVQCLDFVNKHCQQAPDMQIVPKAKVRD